MSDRYEKIRKLLAECRDIAMEWTMRGRIPECGKFGEIAQDLDAVCDELAFLASAPVSVPGGWKLVPIEPTPEMLAANGTCKLAAGQQMLNDDARKTWRAMLSAAPSFTEEIAALLHEEETGEPWTVAGVEHPGPDRDYYLGLASKVAALVTKHQEPPLPSWNVAHLIAAQAAEVEALRAEVDALREQEPAAWLITGSRAFRDTVVTSEATADRRLSERGDDGSCKVPLYAAPQPEEGR